jgi:diguanylate cyclase (GGDEF)-like protein
LTVIGSRLRDNARAADTYFRLGGDEFVAILDAGSDGSSAAQRISSAVAEPVSFGPHALAVEVSIGLAAYPADGENPQDLIRAADAAMYEAKKANREWGSGHRSP